MTPKLPTLPDYLRPGLPLVFVGANPGLYSAKVGHYYAKPGNQFWPLLAKAGFVPKDFTANDDARILRHGIGLTDLVKRPTAGVADLNGDELDAGAEALRRKLRRYRPRVVAFNGKQIYEAFAGGRRELGLQTDRAEGAVVYVMPSTSSRGASYQVADKLRYFRALKRIVDKERGRAARR